MNKNKVITYLKQQMEKQETKLQSALNTPKNTDHFKAYNRGMKHSLLTTLTHIENMRD